MQVTATHLRLLSTLGDWQLPWSAFLWRAEDERNVYLLADTKMGIAIPLAAVPLAQHQALLREHVSA